MSVKVNLLPQESKRDAQASQQRAVAAGVFVLFLAGLGGIYLWQQGTIDDANETLAAEQNELQMLQAREGELAPYAELQARAQETVGRLELALGDEVSVAGVLQDIATVFPSDAELSSLNLAFEDPRQPRLGGDRAVVGSLNVTGFALQGHAPGVERLLLALDALGSLDSTYATTSTLDEDGVSSFSVQAEFGPEVRTFRYVDVDLEDLR